MAERRGSSKASIAAGCAGCRPAALWVRNRKRKPERCRDSHWGSHNDQSRVSVAAPTTAEWGWIFRSRAAAAPFAAHAVHRAVATLQTATLEVGLECAIRGLQQAGISGICMQEASAALAEDGGVPGHPQASAVCRPAAALWQQVVAAVGSCPDVRGPQPRTYHRSYPAVAQGARPLIPLDALLLLQKR